MQPDLSAPGVNILAAWIPTDQSSDTIPRGMMPSQFNIISGTSMATPHVSGAAAFVKSRNTAWSTSAVRSALMTTGTLSDRPTSGDSPFYSENYHVTMISVMLNKSRSSI